MELMLLTKATTPVIGWIANLLGLMMDGIFRVTSMFGVTNIGLCIIIFTIIINLFLYPLTVQQQKGTKLQSVMQPELQAIQKKYKGKTDNASMMKMQTETKAVYQKYGTSMTGGCIQLLIQMPILFALYQVIYNIPAYVPSVKVIFENVATALQGQPDYTGTITALLADASLKMPKMAANMDYSVVDKIIDLLYKFTPANWEQLKAAFPAVSDVITSNAAEIIKMNSFLGVNLAVAPFQGWTPNLAWLIPVLSGLTQWYSIKLTTFNQPAAGTDDNNSVAAQMKTMNTMMPLMSVFFCFTLASGLGVYWVASAACRIVQQFIINGQLSKMDVDEIVRQNLEKVNKKREKQGLKPQQLQEEKRIIQNAKKYEEKQAQEESMKEKKLSEIAKQVKDSTSYYNSNAKPGSLAAKANMVALYDERAAEKKRGKKAKGEEVKGEEARSEETKPEDGGNNPDGKDGSGNETAETPKKNDPQ